MNKQIPLILLLVAAAIVTACSGQTESEVESESCEASVTGTVDFPDLTDPPGDYAVRVAIVDASIDLSSTVGSSPYLSDQAFRNSEQFPISYELCYDSSEVEEDVTYTIWVNVEQKPSSMTLGLNEALNPVITGGNPTKDVDIIVTPGFAEPSQ